MKMQPLEPQSLQKLSFKSLKPALHLFSPIHAQSAPPPFPKINQECEGEQIVHALVKNALDIYVEMGKRLIKYYEKDFEEAMLKKTATFYSQKASNWITSKSYEDYMLKVVEHGLLIANAMELQEKKQPDGEAPSIDEM